jgi:hypothetical protein
MNLFRGGQAESLKIPHTSRSEASKPNGVVTTLTATSVQTWRPQQRGPSLDGPISAFCTTGNSFALSP